MSTVGFGDFYPKSDGERIIGSLMILFGVALFSVIISEFLDMITRIKSILSQETDDELLESFFVMFKSLNDQKMLKQSIIDEITSFMKFKWGNDKNNFLKTEEDHTILQKVSLKEEKTTMELYTKFIYMKVLKRFNRFFTQRK